MLTIGSLFAGIGGFDLGLERTGHMRTVWFCEQDPYCQRVLAKHWPGVPCHGDVRTLVADTASRQGGQNGACLLGHGERGLARSKGGRGARGLGGGGRDGAGGQVPVLVPYVDILTGGFPCQDLSYAGRGAGITGERSGLWTEYARLIRELRPRYVLVENVPALLARGMGRVLGDLAACGYDAEWDCVPASAVGAPHRRDRVWIIAYPAINGRVEGVADFGGRGAGTGARQEPRPRNGREDDADADGEPSGRLAVPRGQRGHWESEPDVGRVAHGIPARVDRLRALGNALVPQIAEWLGWRIVAYEQERERLAA